MHPGWACFLAAYGSGMATVWTMLYVIVHADWGFIWGAGVAIGLFVLGGRKAEKLYDRF